MKLTLLFYLAALAFTVSSKSQWIQYDKAADPADSLIVRSFVKSINLLNNGDIVTAFDGGLYQFSNGLWEAYPREIPWGDIGNAIKDSLDNLWVSTYWGLKYFDTKLRKMTKFYQGKTWAWDSTQPPPNQFYNFVTCIALDSTGGLWLSGASNVYDLAYFKEGIWTKHHITDSAEVLDYGVQLGFSSNIFLEAEKSGALWYNSYNGIVRFDPKTGMKTFFDTLRIGNDTILFKSAGKLHIARNGTIWMNAQPNYILSFEPKDSVWTVYNKKDIPSLRAEDATFSLFRQAVTEDAKGNQWMTFRDDYLAKFDTTTKKWKKIQLPNGRSYNQGLKTYINHGLAVDSKGNVWVGTLGEGVVVYTGDANGVAETNSIEGLARTWIFSITPNPIARQAKVQVFADPEFRSSLRVGLFSVLGSQVRDFTASTHIDWATGHGTVDIDADDIPNGMYLLRVANGADNYVSLVPVMR